MSTTLSTNAMITELQFRFGMGAALTTATCLERLNMAYRWIETQGSFVWNLKIGSLTLLANTLSTPMPIDFNPGKLWSLWHQTKFYAVKYVSFDDFQMMRTEGTTVTLGYFGGVTLVNVPATSQYSAVFGPDSAKDTLAPNSFDLYYHRMTPAELTAGASTYFPTPDEFDDLIVDLAECRIRQHYNYTRWADMLQLSQAQVLKLLDQYRSTKLFPMGVDATVSRAGEKAAKASR
jgi:hypothetical protein